jgi:predicted transcriptional regulator
MDPNSTEENRDAHEADKVSRNSADRDAIFRGIADMKAGRVLSLKELDARIQAKIRDIKSA